MNIHAYTLDSLRQLVRRLQKENAELRLQLKNAYQTKTEASIFENNYEVEPEYDEDQGRRHPFGCLLFLCKMSLYFSL